MTSRLVDENNVGLYSATATPPKSIRKPIEVSLRVIPDFHYLKFLFKSNAFLSRDSSAERGDVTVSHVSVCPPVTFRYHDHIGWNCSKIISRPNSLRPMRSLTATWAIWFYRAMLRVAR